MIFLTIDHDWLAFDPYPSTPRFAQEFPTLLWIYASCPCRNTCLCTMAFSDSSCLAFNVFIHSSLDYSIFSSHRVNPRTRAPSLRLRLQLQNSSISGSVRSESHLHFPQALTTSTVYEYFTYSFFSSYRPAFGVGLTSSVCPSV